MGGCDQKSLKIQMGCIPEDCCPVDFRQGFNEAGECRFLIELNTGEILWGPECPVDTDTDTNTQNTINSSDGSVVITETTNPDGTINFDLCAGGAIRNTPGDVSERIGPFLIDVLFDDLTPGVEVIYPVESVTVTNNTCRTLIGQVRGNVTMSITTTQNPVTSASLNMYVSNDGGSSFINNIINMSNSVVHNDPATSGSEVSDLVDQRFQIGRQDLLPGETVEFQAYIGLTRHPNQGSRPGASVRGQFSGGFIFWPQAPQQD